MPDYLVKQPAKLLDFLFASLEGYKRTTVKNLLKFRQVSVNGKYVTQFDFPLSSGDKVAIQHNKQKAMSEDLKSQLDILYEDDDIIVIEKPSGLLTVGTEKIRTQTAYYKVYEYLKLKMKADLPGKKRFEQPVFIVHRLDKEASGVLLLAKTFGVKTWLQDNWHEFEKRYYAVVHGVPGKKDGTIESYLHENKFLQVHSSPEPGRDAKLAITHYRTVKTGKHYSLLEVLLETGRKHQIRVHLSDMGHPIAGDDRYGGDITKKRTPFKRLTLHAHSLEILHPTTRKTMTFKSRLPKELEDLL